MEASRPSSRRGGENYGIQNILWVAMSGVVLGIVVSVFLRETAPRKVGMAASPRGRGHALNVKPIAFACAVLALLNLSGHAQSPSTTQVHGAVPTFNRDVAPILFNVCVGCHRPGGVGPMSLLTFESARRTRNRSVKRSWPVRCAVVRGSPIRAIQECTRPDAGADEYAGRLDRWRNAARRR